MMKISKGTMSAGVRNQASMRHMASVLTDLARLMVLQMKYESQSIDLQRFEDNAFEYLESLAHWIEEEERKDELDAEQREEIQSIPVRAKRPTAG